MTEPDLSPYRFAPGAQPLVRLPTSAPDLFADEDAARAYTATCADAIARHQLMLEAHGVYGLLVIVQGMDAAGKDEAIHHVFSTTDPGSGEAHAFSSLPEPDAPHDFLRRAAIRMPARGEIGVFNRSYYEQVTSDRVSPDLLDEQHLPPGVLRGAVDGSLWTDRLRQIRDYERYLHENGIRIVKLFFHVSKDEQRRRLIERIERPEKRWDFSRADIEKRAHWDAFLDAYDHAFEATSTPDAPWLVLPSDDRWTARALAAAAVRNALANLHTDFPEPDDELAETLAWARKRLDSE
jgi:PPK2 family polyphosphate:nucleotide phosphotransferase